jgi:hypothetical protein
MSVSDIKTFFAKSSRGENDTANKIREKILNVITNPPQAYLDDAEWGNSWQCVHNQWTQVLKELNSTIPYTSTKMTVKGGRGFNYDGIVMYYNEATLVNTVKIEFKYGCTCINALPQFLSLQACTPWFPETYDSFYYDKYLPEYLACDTGITAKKPSKEDYVKQAKSTVYSITPFFEQLKNRESFFKAAKNKIVNASITDYLTRFGKTLDIAAFSEKVKSSQTDKIYLLWSNEKFHVDRLNESEMTDMTFHSIKNGNTILIQSGNTMYELLLRWRNHKGILNPAWQIKMKRQQK